MIFKIYVLAGLIALVTVNCKSAKESGLPLASDLDIYLNAIRGVVKYTLNSKAIVSANYIFGLILLNVNLKYLLKHKNKYLSENLYRELTNITGHLDDAQTIYANIVKNHLHHGLEEKHDIIYRSFSNQTAWIDRLSSFGNRPHLMLRIVPNFLQKLFSYDAYLENIFAFEKWEPSPVMSDYCIKSLSSSNPPKQNLKQCKLPERCRNILETGTDFGYSLTHRIVLLLMARSGLRCSILSSEADRLLIRDLCNVAYNEGHYIGAQSADRQVLDLVMEQVAVCSTQGFFEFIQREWFFNALHYQTRSGCFMLQFRGNNVKHKGTTFFRKTIPMKAIPIKAMNTAICNDHFTSATAAALGAAVRFILEREAVKEDAWNKVLHQLV